MSDYRVVFVELLIRECCAVRRCLKSALKNIPYYCSLHNDLIFLMGPRGFEPEERQWRYYFTLGWRIYYEQVTFINKKTPL
jgi:hypothetical protein